MAGRIRTVKPEFFTHEGLYDLERQTGLPIRLAFIGLWTQADRAGRFKWRPRPLKTAVLPYDEVDFAEILAALVRAGHVVRYEADGEGYGSINGFVEHQRPNSREPDSKLPQPPDVDDDSRAPDLLNLPHPPACEDSEGLRTHAHAQGEREGKGTGRERRKLASASFSAELSENAQSAADEAAMTFPTTGKNSRAFILTKAKFAEYAAAYPALDVPQELRNARQWLTDNPRNRKTHSGVLRFLTNWLNRAQNRGGRAKGTTEAPREPCQRCGDAGYLTSKTHGKIACDCVRGRKWHAINDQYPTMADVKGIA